MKYLILSDIHLNRKFDQNKLDLLMQIVSKADEVVLAGDFWEEHQLSFAKLAETKWKPLLDLLSQKNTVFIPGNHDQHAAQQHVTFTSNFTEEYRIEVGNRTYVVRHGHHIAPTMDVRNPRLFSNKYAMGFGTLFQLVGLHLRGQNFFRVFTILNNRMKKWAAENLSDNEILIAGHSHLQEDAFDEKLINSGVFKFGYAQYLWITNDGYELVNERY